MESITSLINSGTADSVFRAQELIRHRLTVASLQSIDEIRSDVASALLNPHNDADIRQEHEDN